MLIRFEPGDALRGVGVRSPQSPPMLNVELSLTAKPQDVTLVDTGSNPVAQPTHAGEVAEWFKALVC